METPDPQSEPIEEAPIPEAAEPTTEGGDQITTTESLASAGNTPAE